MTLGALMARLVGRGAVKAYSLSIALLLPFLVGNPNAADAIALEK